MISTTREPMIWVNPAVSEVPLFRKGDTVISNKGTYLVVAHWRNKRVIRFRGLAWSYCLVRDYVGTARVMGV